MLVEKDPVKTEAMKDLTTQGNGAQGVVSFSCMLLRSVYRIFLGHYNLKETCGAALPYSSLP
jgi:hypothetical protein